MSEDDPQGTDPPAAAMLDDAGPVGLDADRIRAVAGGCVDVVRLHPGRFGEVATYLPGRRVAGVAITETAVTVHLVARLGAHLPTVAEAVRAAVVRLARGRRVDVVIEDVSDGTDDGVVTDPAPVPTAARVRAERPGS